MDLVELQLRQTLVPENRAVSHVYFPESGICSIFAVSGQREIIEAGLLGREGMTSSGCDAEGKVPLRIVVQAAGHAWRVPIDRLTAVSESSPSFLRLILKYQQTMNIQACFTSLSHGRFSITARLARWLLMYQDRVGDIVPMVHEFMALMLGVRRAGVTDAVHVLEGKKIIRASRGRIAILNRMGLMSLAQGVYGQPEAYYESLIGDFGRPHILAADKRHGTSREP